MFILKEKFEDTKCVIKNRKSKKNRQYNDKNKKKGQTMMYKTLHRKLKIEKHEPMENQGAPNE